MICVYAYYIQYLVEDEVPTEKGSTMLVEKTNTTAFRVNNNLLAEWEGFMDTLDALVVNPATNLAWLDLSFNDLKSIDSVSTLTSTSAMFYRCVVCVC